MLRCLGRENNPEFRILRRKPSSEPRLYILSWKQMWNWLSDKKFIKRQCITIILLIKQFILRKGFVVFSFSRIVKLTEENLKKRETWVNFHGQPQRTTKCSVGDADIGNMAPHGDGVHLHSHSGKPLIFLLHGWSMDLYSLLKHRGWDHCFMSVIAHFTGSMQEDRLSPGAQDQPGQHNETSSLQKIK